MKKKILLLGNTGKMGIALDEVLKDDYIVTGKNSNDFDASDFESVKKLVKDQKPNILINTVAFLGIDPCEKDPVKALMLNTLYPKLLSELSNELNFTLIHFSTDAVFNDDKNSAYEENDSAKPLNIYGFTKYGGDCFIQNISKKYYLIRISILFGETTKNNQFVEKMILNIKSGAKELRIADDIISSPSYSLDVAKEIKRIIEKEDYGLYHVVNSGNGTLYELMSEIAKVLSLSVNIKKASYKDFPYIGMKNTNTPLVSEKIKPLRHWKEAVKDYALRIKNKK